MATKVDQKTKSLAAMGVGKYIAMTFVGAGLFITGFLMAILTPVILANGGNEAIIALTVVGFVIMFGPGLALMGVGIPCWIVMGIRIKKAQNRLVK